MRTTLAALLAASLSYASPALADNSPSALGAEALAALEGMAPDDVADKLTLHKEPRPFRDKSFVGADGEETDLTAFEGRVVLVNFWATWCPPCLKELPGMDRLQADLGAEGLTIVPISLDRGGISKAGKWWRKAGFEALALYADPDKDLAKEMGVLALPVTAILGPDGREIGRVVGDAEWDSDEAKAMLRWLIEETGVKAPLTETQETALPARPG